MTHSLKYQELEAPEQLRRHVRCVWHLELKAGSGFIETVYPDGCCELITHRKTPMHAFSPETGWQRQEQCVFVAQQRSAIRLAARSDVDCIGVRLQPAASAVLVKTSLAALGDHIVDLANLDVKFARHFVTAATQVAAGTSFVEVWDLLKCHLLPLQIDERIENAVSRLETCDGQGPVTPIVAASGMSQRSFQSTFKEQVGLSAKQFARILRLQAIIRRLDDEFSSMAQLAVDRGFSDQSHATREIRRVTSTTPAQLYEALRQDRTGDSSVRLAAAFVRGGSGSRP